MKKDLPKIYIGGDHASFLEREKVQKYLFEHGYEVYSEGSYSTESANYAEYALKVATKVKENPDSCGIVMCGSGIGVNIAANKVKGIKSTLVYTNSSAAAARKNNYPIIALGTRFMNYEKLIQYINTYLGINDKDDCESCCCNYKEQEEVTKTPSPFILMDEEVTVPETPKEKEEKQEQELLDWAKQK